MAWHLVKQPNRLFACYVEDECQFYFINFDYDEAQRYITTRFGHDVFSSKMYGANKDDIWGRVETDDGLNRWMHCIDTVRRIHGQIEYDHIIRTNEHGEYTLIKDLNNGMENR